MLSCGSFEREFIREVALSAEAEFRHPVSAEECFLELSPFYNAGRRQYNGDALLHHLPHCTRSGYKRLIALFSVDLYIPILTYIFGQAKLGDREAIASVYRLRNEMYGLQEDEALLLSRTIKEVNHELGHTFGLLHCRSLDCVMRSSTYVEEIDLKGASLCHDCRQLLDGAII